MRVRAMSGVFAVFGVFAVSLVFASTPKATTQATPVFVTQTDANLSQALSALPRLHFSPGTPPRRLRVITIDEGRRFQRMQGFGAAMTDTSAWLIWDELTPGRRGQLLQRL